MKSGQYLTNKQWFSDGKSLEPTGRTQKVGPVGSWVLDSGNVVAQALAVSMDKPLDWAVGFFFGNTELSLELWNIISDISGLDDRGKSMRCPECGANEGRQASGGKDQSTKWKCGKCGHEWDIIVAFFKWIRRAMRKLLGKQESP